MIARFLLIVSLVLLGSCGKSNPRGYPLTTCVVCDHSLQRYGAPVTFVHEGQEIKVCTLEHQREFEVAPEPLLKKVRQFQAL